MHRVNVNPRIEHGPVTGKQMQLDVHGPAEDKAFLVFSARVTIYFDASPLFQPFYKNICLHVLGPH